ncbi:MAG TPA: 6-hydroxymethylpterin diphosphokinase MptE-like protein, partial [Chlamydiales bacterium]|nr:6-hydroxymethylpterin diphosphokinase MptE-like protein [Chlamydiales bacterium]
TLAALSSQGVMPHFGMAIDPNLEEYRRLRNSFAFHVPLLYSTRVFPAVFQTCNGPFGYMRSGIGGLPELWMEEELGLLDPLLGDFLSSESISVTAICLAWAQFLGCNPILLNGVDLAYTGKKRYATGVAEDEEVPFAAIDAEKSAADRILKRKDRNGQPIYTAVRWIMESASLSHFARKHPETTFLNTTEGGLGFRGIDYTPLSTAVRNFPSQDLRTRIHKQIASSPMPPQSAHIIATKMKELKTSLDRIISYLEILNGKQKGSTALAELELKEEMAYAYLFYDIDTLFREDKWPKFLDLALKYRSTMTV